MFYFCNKTQKCWSSDKKNQDPYRGGTRAPFMFDCEMWDSWPKTNAEWQNPDSCKYLYTKKFNSSVEYDIICLIFYSATKNQEI